MGLWWGGGLGKSLRFKVEGSKFGERLKFEVRSFGAQWADDEPVGELAGGDDEGGQHKRRRVGAGLGDEKASQFRRGDAGQVPSEVEDSDPQTNLGRGSAILQDHQLISIRESD